jgi:hypothetical protein
MDAFEIPEAHPVGGSAALPTPGLVRAVGTTWDDSLTADGAPLAPPFDEARDLLRVGGVLYAGYNPSQLFARTADVDWVALKLHAEDAGPFVRALAGVDVPLAAWAVAALLGHSVVESEAQARAVCGLDDPGAMDQVAPAVVAERWRAPHLDDGELVFLSATEPTWSEPNTVFEARANLREGWLDLERVSDGWIARPLPPPPNIFGDPEPLVNRMPDAPLPTTWNPIPDPGPRTGPSVTVSERPRTGLLSRLRRLFGSED